MGSKVDVRHVVQDHFDTLRGRNSGRLGLIDLAWHVAIPIAGGVLILVFGARIFDASQIVEGTAILSGFAFGLAIFVFQLRLSAARDPRVPKGSLLLQLIDELFTNVCYLIIVGLVLVVMTIVATAYTDAPRLGLGWSAVITTVGLHYLATIAMCVKRTTAAYRQLTI